MPKPFKIEDSPLFQITLPDKTKPEKQTKQKEQRPKKINKTRTTHKTTTQKNQTTQITEKITQDIQKPLESYSLNDEFIKKLTDNLIKYHNPTEHIVYLTLLKFSKIITPEFRNNPEQSSINPLSTQTFEIITEPISINKIANLCNISFKTAKRTIRNLIKKGHISIFSPYDSRQNLATRYKIENIPMG